MTEQKRPQTKDISDLKARLGLKKGPAAGSTAAPARPPGSSIAPPPGLAPSNPGASSSGFSSYPASQSSGNLPAQPAPTHDPFAAMNAMAHVGTSQRGPDIVIVNDGKPVESVAAKSSAASFAKLAVVALVPLALGVALGQIAKEGNHYNAGIKGAKQILDTVKNTKKSLASNIDAIERAAKGGFRPSKELSEAIKAASGGLAVDEVLLFQFKQNGLDSKLSGRTLTYFADVTMLASMMKEHVAARADDLLDAAKKRADAARMAAGDNAALASAGAYRYGVFVPKSTTDSTLPALFVELGPPYCNGQLSSDGTCNGPVTEVAFRAEPGGEWRKGVIATGKADTSQDLLYLLKPNGVTDTALRGSEPGAAEYIYVKRAKAIHALAKKLVEEGNRLETDLTKKANESPRFTFFL